MRLFADNFSQSFQHNLRSRTKHQKKVAGGKLVTPLEQHLLTRPNKTESVPENWTHFLPARFPPGGGANRISNCTYLDRDLV